MSSKDSASNRKIGDKYETSPISFEENYVAQEFPPVVTRSDYRTLAWILLKVVIVQYVRSEMDPGAVEWPEVKELIRHKAQIIKLAYAKKDEGVMGYLNQHLKNYASLAHIRSIYDNPAFDVYLSANGGFEGLYDPAVYHFTGWKICRQ